MPSQLLRSAWAQSHVCLPLTVGLCFNSDKPASAPSAQPEPSPRSLPSPFQSQPHPRTTIQEGSPRLDPNAQVHSRPPRPIRDWASHCQAAAGVSNHFKRLVDAWDKDTPDPIIADPDLRDVVVKKSNILLIGPSGSGKTHLVKSLASYLDVPLAIGDATSLTEAGYVGDDVEILLSRLIQTTGGDMDAAQRGIVYIDEIDKIKTTGSGFKDMRLGVQHSLLKMLEGTIATVPPAGGYKQSGSTRRPLRHDQRPVHLRRGICGVGRHHRQASRAGWVRLRSVWKCAPKTDPPWGNLSA